MTEANDPESGPDKPEDGHVPSVDDLVDLVKKNGHHVGKVGLPALGAAALAAFFVARSRKRHGERKSGDE